jgi:hypothetical protein
MKILKIKKIENQAYTLYVCACYAAEVGTYDDIKSVKHIFGNPV